MPLSRDRRHWKGHTLNWTRYSLMEDLPSLCVQLSPRDQSILIAALTPLYWGTRWENADGIDIPALVAEIERRIQSPCGEISMTQFQLRQSGGDPCRLEQSSDGGATWSLAFDYSLCQPGIDVATEINTWTQINESNTSIVNLYLGGDELASDYLAEDAERQRDILCYFLGILIHEMIEQFIAVKSAQQEEGELLPTALAIGLGVASALLAIPTAGASVGVSALVWASVGTLLASASLAFWLEYDSYDPADLQNESIQDEAKCWLLQQWADTLPSESAFRGLNADNAPGSIADIIEILAAGFDSVDVYANFRVSVNAAASIPSWYPACDCNEDWAYRWDFTASDGGWDAPTTEYGEYVAGSGWQTTRPASAYRIDSIAKSLPDVNTTRIAVAYVVPTNAQMSNEAMTVRLYDSGGAEIQSATFKPLGGGDNSIELVQPYADVARIEIFLTYNGGGNGVIDAVIIEGVGAQPALAGGEFV